MTELLKGGPPSRVRQGVPVLFVEGASSDSFDVITLQVFLESKIDVLPLGSSNNIKNAAEALHNVDPKYYFLIDRDHYEDHFVEACWRNFPDPNKSNLLIWRKREIENYFLDPGYLMKMAPEHLRHDEEGIKQTILKYARKRLYFDVANMVITSIREDQKNTWIDHFPNPEEIPDRDSALDKLKGRTEFNDRVCKVQDWCDSAELERRFDRYLGEATGGAGELEFGVGKWESMLRGKQIFHSMANECFSFPEFGQGDETRIAAARTLLGLPLEDQPEDFQKLRNLIAKISSMPLK